MIMTFCCVTLSISVHRWRSKPATTRQRKHSDTSRGWRLQGKVPEVSEQGHKLVPCIPHLQQGDASQRMRQIGQRDQASSSGLCHPIICGWRGRSPLHAAGQGNAYSEQGDIWPDLLGHVMLLSPRFSSSAPLKLLSGFSVIFFFGDIVTCQVSVIRHIAIPFSF